MDFVRSSRAVRPSVLGKVVGELDVVAGRRAPRRSPPPLCCRRRRPGSPLVPPRYFPSFVNGRECACRRARVMYLRAQIVRAGPRSVRGMRLVRWKRAFAIVCVAPRQKYKRYMNCVRKTKNKYGHLLYAYNRRLESFHRLLYVHRFRGVSPDAPMTRHDQIMFGGRRQG